MHAHGWIRLLVRQALNERSALQDTALYLGIFNTARVCSAASPDQLCRPSSAQASCRIPGRREGGAASHLLGSTFWSKQYIQHSLVSQSLPQGIQQSLYGARAHSLLSLTPCPAARCFSTATQPVQPPRTALSRHIIYRGPWLLPFRMLVRMKVIQLSWIAALALPVWTVVTEVQSLHEHYHHACLLAASKPLRSCGSKLQYLHQPRPSTAGC